MSDEQGNAIRGLADQVEYLQRQLKRADEALAASRSQVDEMIRAHDEQTAELARVTEQRLRSRIRDTEITLGKRHEERDQARTLLASERQRSERYREALRWALEHLHGPGWHGYPDSPCHCQKCEWAAKSSALIASDAPGTEAPRGTFPGDLDRMPSGHTRHCEARRKWGDGECECGAASQPAESEEER